ncbi:uncharacterized protein LOC144629318 isoform X2 [Oculina patagonica]
MRLSRLGIHVFIAFAVVIAGQVSAYPKEGPGCGALLTDAIVGSTIEVTTSHNASFNEDHALLNSSNAWCSSILDPQQYLKVSLDKPANLSGFELQGRSSSNQYLTKFKINYKANASAAVQRYPTAQNPKTFELSPADGDEIVYFPLNGTRMQTVIFRPSDWSGHICMRLELYGCVQVDGGYTPWSNWTRCSSSCGSGSSVRYRICSDPAPANGGQDCIGESIETKECIGQSCPVDGGFSDWSNWTACSVSCGTGFQLRRRTCTNPPPMYGGKLCESNSSTEVRSCLVATCEDGPGEVGARTSDEGKDKNKYFIPMLVLAVAFAFFIVIAVAVICSLRKGPERNWNNNSIQNKSSEQMENKYEEIAVTSANMAKG